MNMTIHNTKRRYLVKVNSQIFACRNQAGTEFDGPSLADLTGGHTCSGRRGPCPKKPRRPHRRCAQEAHKMSCYSHRRKLRHKSGGLMASAEREAITGVWGWSPQRGPGAFCLSQVQMGRKFANFCCLVNCSNMLFGRPL